MRFVEEIVVESFLPTVRSMLAERLRERGLTQRDIADAIGVSQSAVSKYVHGEVARHEEIRTHPRVQETVDELVDGLVDGGMDRVAALIELEVLVRSMEAPGELLAVLHEREVPDLADREPFRVHDPDSRIRQRERVRSAVRSAIQRIEETTGFVDLLPQVGANVVQVLPDGTEVQDVAGVPGRIIDVEGRVEIPGEPRFGVSGHLAGILLAAREAGSPAAAALNVRYAPELFDTLQAGGRSTIEIAGDDDVREAVIDRMASDVQVIAQTGGFGVEPIIYVLAEDAPATVEIACDLLDR